MTPDAPPVATPLRMITEPVGPDTVVPVVRESEPLEPCEGASAVRMLVSPDTPDVEPPLEIVTEPPVLAARESPACNSRWPPVDDDDVPTDTLMEPDGPLTAFPVKIETLPLVPDVVLPVVTTR
jgi:hypothetical protein